MYFICANLKGGLYVNVKLHFCISVLCSFEIDIIIKIKILFESHWLLIEIRPFSIDGAISALDGF